MNHVKSEKSVRVANIPAFKDHRWSEYNPSPSHDC